jgi:hypothetical protein
LHDSFGGALFTRAARRQRGRFDFDHTVTESRRRALNHFASAVRARWRGRVSAGQHVDDLAVRPRHAAKLSRLLQCAAGLVDRLAWGDTGAPGEFVVIDWMTAEAQRFEDALAVSGRHAAEDAGTARVTPLTTAGNCLAR